MTIFLAVLAGIAIGCVISALWDMAEIKRMEADVDALWDECEELRVIKRSQSEERR